jgi:AAA family ATP:ADP antiporter
MIGRIPGKILSVLGIRPGERLRVGLMSLYFFLVITSYYVIKPVRNSLFVERLGADNLPYVYIITALVVGIIIAFYSRFADRIGRQALLLGTAAFLASNLIFFWWILRTGTLFASGAFYIWAKLYPLLLVSQFWLVANELFTTSQARRVFGVVGAGGIVGGVAGSAIAGAFATLVGSAQLLFVSAVILGLSALLMAIIDRVAEPVRARPVRGRDEKPKGAWRLFKESPHLRTIAYVLGLTIIVSTVVDWQFNKALELFVPGEDAKTQFLGRFFTILNIASVGVQLLLTSFVLRVFGLGLALLLLPIGLLTGSIGIIAHPGLWTAALAKGAEGSLRYSLDQSTRELLFLPLSPELKYRGKPLIDIVVYRGGTGVAGLILLSATSLFSFGLREMAILSSALIALWMGVTFSLRREFRSSVRRLIRTRDVEPEEMIVRHLDAATRAELRDALRSDDENSVLYALTLLDGVDDRAIAERADYLLEHRSERVRARTLRALLGSSSGADLSGPQRLLDDPSMEVRVEAMNLVCQLGPLPASETIEEFLQSKAPEVRSAALACLAQQPDSERTPAATALIAEMAYKRGGPGAARERRLAAEAIGMIEGRAQVGEVLAELLDDRDDGVRRTAANAAARIKRPELVPHLLSQLCCRDRRPEARAALAAYGPTAFGMLSDAMRDPQIPLEVRKAIPAIFYETGGQIAVDALLGSLLEVPPAVRRMILKTLNRMRRNHEGLSFDPETLDRALYIELRDAYQTAADRVVFEDGSLLSRVLRESQAWSFERAFRILGLLYPLRDILAAYQGLTSKAAGMRSAGAELLANTLSVRHRRITGPLADPDLPLVDRARRSAAMFDDVAIESRDAVYRRLAGRTDNLWLATVAAASSGYSAAQIERRVRKPFHVHPLPGTGLPLSRLLSEDGATMLKLVERADFLRAVEIFSDVRTEDLAKIAAIARERQYDAGAVLFEEGKEGSELFLIVSGQVQATRREELAFIADPGESVGTLSLIDARPREFTGTATKHTRALVIEREDFYDLMRDHFDLAEGLLTHLTDVVRRLNVRVEQANVGV